MLLRFPSLRTMDTHSIMTKDVGLRIRLEKTLRDEFVAACHANDRPAAEAGPDQACLRLGRPDGGFLKDIVHINGLTPLGSRKPFPEFRCMVRRWFLPTIMADANVTYHLKRISLLCLGVFGQPSIANAYCVMPSANYDKLQSAIAWANYDHCVQQERQAEQQRNLAEQQRLQMERQRQQMELQRRQMEAQQLEMQRQTQIQRQQLELQQQQLEEQRQLRNYPSASSKAANLNAYLTETARNYNDQLPLKLDDVTNLVRVDAGNGVLTVVHQLSFEVDTQDQIDKMAKIVGPKACSDPATKQNINVYRVKYIYRYFTPSGRYFDIFMNPGSC